MQKIRVVVTAISILVCALSGALARSADAPALTREQATRLLDNLKDPQKREQFTQTLEAYVKALPAEAAASVPPAPAATSEASTTAPATPPAKKTHGASPLKRAFDRLQHAGVHLAQDLRSVTDLPALSAWLGSKFDEPSERAAFQQGSLWIVLIVAVTIGSEWLLRALIRPTP